MATRTAQAEWRGDLISGEGSIKTGSAALEGPYSFASRFENGAGTNPEELIAAAHAGCFSMALAAMLTEAGFVPTSVKTTASVSIEKVGEGFAITQSNLRTQVQSPRIDETTFLAKAAAAKEGCPVSKALAGVRITLDAKLLPESGG